MTTAFLTREQEHDLALRWREHRDERARDRLIACFDPLVKRIAARCKARGCNREDMEQEGRLGLIEAIDRFDPHLGNRLATFAQWWIRAMVLNYVFCNAQIIRHAAHAKGKRRFFSGEYDFRVTSIETPLPGQDDITLGSTLPAPDIDIDRLIDTQRGVDALRAAMEVLKPREHDIIRRRYLSEDIETLNTVGDDLGISKERVRQIEVKALDKIKRKMRVAA